MLHFTLFIFENYYICFCIASGVPGRVALPTNLTQFFELSSKEGDVLKSMLIFLLAYITWSLWLTCNDYVFNNKIIAHPDVLVHRSIIFMQKWSILLK